MKEPNHFLIYGFGLMGGSLALAVRNAYPNSKITGIVRSERSKEEGIRLKLADDFYLESEFLNQRKFSDFDFVVFGLPVTRLVELIPSLKDFPDTVFTDLGSTKYSIIDSVNNYLGESHSYVSSHPMCGSEESGLAKSIPNLYVDKITFISRCKNSRSIAIDSVLGFWKKLGSWVIEVEPELHDEVLSYVSHLPHIISTLLVTTSIQNKSVSNLVKDSSRAITGGGFRDMSRIAGSNWEMWKSIFEENRRPILESLLSFEKNLKEVIEIFQNWKEPDIQRLEGIWRDSLNAKIQINKTGFK